MVSPGRCPQFGLLEVKAPQALTLADVTFLQKTDAGFQLKKKHPYFFQILCQLAVTGLDWCDLFVYLPNNPGEFHQEEVKFDSELWQEVKNKLEYFYFSFFLID